MHEDFDRMVIPDKHSGIAWLRFYSFNNESNEYERFDSRGNGRVDYNDHSLTEDR